MEDSLEGLDWVVVSVQCNKQKVRFLPEELNEETAYFYKRSLQLHSESANVVSVASQASSGSHSTSGAGG